MSKLKIEILNSLKETLSSSSVHGIANIIKSKYITIKIMWIVFFIISNGFCSWFIFNSIADYLSYDATSKIEIKYERLLKFPMVSLCNLNPLLSKYDLKQVVISCKFNLVNCDLENDFEFYYDSNYLICFRYNSGKNANGKTVPSKYSYIKGGSLNALNLELFVGSTNDDPDSDYGITENGLMLFITDESSSSESIDGIKVSTGFSTDIILNKFTIILKAYPYSNCVEDLTTINSYKSICYKKTLATNKTYRFIDCANLCFQKYVGDECNCQIYFMGPFYYTNLSDYKSENINCVTQSYTEFGKTTKYLDECDCPLECQKSGYTYSYSMSEYPTKSYMNTLKNSSLIQKFYANNDQNITYENLREKILTVRIFYDELKHTIIRNEVKTSLASLVSNLGGTIGLFCGFSFLSIVELFEVIVQSIIIIAQNNGKNKIAF